MKVRQFKNKYIDIDELSRDLASIGNQENTFTLTLTANAASTTDTNDMVGTGSTILFMPTTAHAAADMNSMYVSSRGKKTFTVTHANNAFTDRTFIYTVIG